MATRPGAPERPNAALVLTKLVGALVAAGILVAGLVLPFVGGIGLAADQESKKFLSKSCNLQETPPPQKTRLYASDAKTLIATIFKQDRQPIALTQVPEYLQRALVATEDRRFFSHHGVDMRGLIRSAVSTTSGDTQGGSTLTMQYVKQIRYYQAGDDLKKQQLAIDQNLNRKIEDAKCALYIENTEHESKAAILDNYLNIAFFGENSYGIETAAQTYFGKHARALTLPESAMLVGLLRAPTQYDPFVNPDAARQRRNEVLQSLVSVGDLTQPQADRYAATPVALATTKPPQVREGCANAPSSVINVGFFCSYAVNWLIEHKVVTDAQLRTGGLRIVTTLDAGLQNSVQSRLAKSMPGTSPMTAVMPVLDPRSGNVLAMATTKKYGNPTSTKDRSHTTLPIFTEYSAQGASTYKLFPLLAALSTGVPSGWLLQTPPSSQGYQTQNCVTTSRAKNGDANEFYNANESLSTATTKSSNTFFVGMADQLLGCQLKPIVDIAERLGMTGLRAPSDQRGQTVAQTIVNLGRAQQLVLGDVGTSPLEIAGAYAGVTDNGKYNVPAPIVSVNDNNGRSITVPRSPGVQAVAPQVAQQAIKILSGDTRSPGTSADAFRSWYKANHSDVAGKTGTSTAVDRLGRETNKNASLWFVGMTPNLVAATGLINFDHPNAAAAGLPGIADPGHDAYGAYASKLWLEALRPSLARQSWAWEDPGLAPGDSVPDVTGLTLAEAKSRLTTYGYKMAQLDPSDQVLCASSHTLSTIAYYAPQRAPRGSTITVCPSSGRQQSIYVPPPPPPPPPPVTQPSSSSHGHPAPSPGGSSSGNGHSPPPHSPPPHSPPPHSPPPHSPGPGNGSGGN
ncbi:MAG: transglycosylase domain-containing protein [Actinomycetota bacterium]|nr:transglycosylase domain-containing protein [Actinomycetota bacterium]